MERVLAGWMSHGCHMTQGSEDQARYPQIRLDLSRLISGTDGTKEQGEDLSHAGSEGLSVCAG